MEPAISEDQGREMSNKSFAREELDNLPKRVLVETVLQLQHEVERLRQHLNFVDKLWYQSRRSLEQLFDELSSRRADEGPGT
ncbi:hypothetical protein BKA70DRAFT_1437426 [Coprinopsis sp. MPI-PUGE-AT-0042]|nr:hypothetical protein BKA70DRAFT_1437426 [Coprinopsis sp. MPI-PUGE-AT-0042]